VRRRRWFSRARDDNEPISSTNLSCFRSLRCWRSMNRTASVKVR